MQSWRMVATAFAAVFLSHTIPAVAQSTCSRQCGGNCPQGCTIVGTRSCGVACHSSGCPGTVTCEEFAGPPEGGQCTYYKQLACREQTGPPIEDPSEPSWAVIQFQEWPSRPPHDFQVLAYSDPASAIRGRASVLEHRGEEYRDATRSAPSAAATGETSLSRGPKVRTGLWVDTGAPCAELVPLKLELLEPIVLAPHARQRAVFFRLLVEETGRIVAATVLHSNAPELDELLGTFLREKAHFLTTGGAPAEAFLILTLGPAGDVGYLHGPGRRF